MTVHADLIPATKHLPNFTLKPRNLWLYRLLFWLLDRPRLVGGVQCEDHTRDALRVRVYRPQRPPSPAPALLWFHGGGFVIGRPEGGDGSCSAFARDVGLVVVSVRYRLAPKHRFPAALDDGLDAWKWVQEHASALGIDPARVAVGGESAGAGLAATLAQRLLDLGGTQPVAQLLRYPMLDDRTAARRDLDILKHPVWNNQSNHTGWSCYLGHPPGRATAPTYAVAARRTSLRGLPPTWIGVGDLDLFHEECLTYAHRLQQDDVACTLEDVAGAVHGFVSLAPQVPLSRNVTESENRFLRSHLRG